MSLSWSYLACSPSYKEEDVSPGKILAMSLIPT